MMLNCPRCIHFRFTGYNTRYRCELLYEGRRGDIMFKRACIAHEQIHESLLNVITLLELIVPSIKLAEHDHNI